MPLNGSKKKKKALIFIEDGSYSFDNRVIREVNALQNDGWNITVICPKYKSDPLYKKINDELRVYYYPKPTTESTMGHIVEHSISLILGTALTMWVFVRHGFKVFQACNPMDILWIIALPYKMLGVKFIFDQHDLCPELYLSRGEGGENSFFYRVLSFLEKASYRHANAVIATNESYRDIAIERGGKSKKEIFIVRNGPDLKKFSKVSPDNGLKKQGETLVGYLGNMNPQDGVEYLVDAAAEIVMGNDRKDIKFVFIGGGSSQSGLARKAEKAGLEENVVFTGRVSDPEMIKTLSTCDLCIQPDPYNPLNDKSTMNKVLEYMALEKPVIAFDLKETRVSCGDAALYVKPNDAKELARKIMFLADNPALKETLGKLGRERINNGLSWDYSIPVLLKGYRYVLEKNY